MKTICKKFTALFLVFSVLALSANLYAKERRGAKLVITKKDGQQIEGELITVKENSLLLLNTEGKDASVDIVDIKVIRIVKKSKVWTGAGLGFLICGSGIAMYNELFFKEDGEQDLKHIFTALLGLIGGGAGLLIGAVAGAAAGTDKTIQIEARPDLEIRDTLEKLRKKARIPDHPGIQEMPAYRDISIGLYLGYSSLDYYLDKYWRDGNASADLRYLLGLQVQYFFKDNNSGISFDLFCQNLKEQGFFYPGEEFYEEEGLGSAYFFSFNYDFRFFSNRNKTFNPYLSLGYVFLTIEKSNFEEKLYWPKKNIPIKLGAGLRYKIKDKFFMNTAFYYFSVHKFSSGRIGLEYVF